MGSPIRLIALAILFMIISVPYFNCANGPGTNGLFSGPSNCTNPTQPQLCNGDPTKVRFGSLPTSVIAPATGGAFTFSGTCVDGGFPKVLIFASVYFTASPPGAAAQYTIQNPISCDGGVFNGAGNLPSGITWQPLGLTLVLNMEVFSDVSATVPTQLPALVMANIPMTHP